eukprot:TRINITY_DN685_c0_g1_i3.p1 TRINITY_DN685_c0_g1~~TRINITY_DN685_c0_g1_i3.p1  ORF type:complete len:222 (+),score=41.00 TRINITY_DN685_c0_g1_i3:27-692(+)
MLSINGVLSKLRVVIPRLAVIRSAAVPLYCVRPLSAKPSVVANTSTTDEPAHLQYSGKQFLTLDHDLPVYENTRSAVLRRMSYIALGQFGLCTLAVPWVLSVDSYDVASRYGIAAGILCAGGTLLAMGDRMLGRFVCNVYLLPGGKRARMTTMRLLGTKTSGMLLHAFVMVFLRLEFDVSDVVISDTAVQEYKQGQPSIQFEYVPLSWNAICNAAKGSRRW